MGFKQLFLPDPGYAFEKHPARVSEETKINLF